MGKRGVTAASVTTAPDVVKRRLDWWSVLKRMLATLWLAGVGYVAVGIVQAIAEGSTPPLLKPLLPILKYLVQQPRYVQGVAAVVFLAVVILSAWVTFRAWLVKQEERGRPSPATSRWGEAAGCGVGGV